MEEERGGMGPGGSSSGGVSKSSLSGKLPDKSLLENKGEESKMDECYEEGNGGEIMVEVVGSDVFVDGVGSQKVSELGFEKIADLAEIKDEGKEEIAVEAPHASNEVDQSKMGAGELRLSGSMSEPNVDGGVSEMQSRAVILDSEAQKPGDELGVLGSREIGDLPEQKDEEREEIAIKASGLSNEGFENNMGSGKVELLGSMVEQSDVAMEEVDPSVNESGDVGERGFSESQSRGVDVLHEAQKPVDEVTDLGSGEIGDLAANKDQEEEGTAVKAADASKEGCGNKIGAREVGLLGLTSKQNDSAMAAVDVNVNESVDVGDEKVSELPSRGVGVLLDEELKPGDERFVASTSSVLETVFGDTEEIVEGTSLLIPEEKVINETVDKSSAKCVMPELVSHPVAVGEEKICAAEKEEILTSNDGSQTAEPDVLIDSTYEGPKDERSEINNAVAEAGLVNATEGGEVLMTGPSAEPDVLIDSTYEGPKDDRSEINNSDAEAGLVNATEGGEVLMTSPSAEPDVLIDSTYEGTKDDRSDINNSDAEAGLVNATEGGEVLMIGPSKDRVSDADKEDAKSVEEKGFAIENKDMAQTSAVTSNVLDEDVGGLKQLHETKHQIGETEEKLLVSERGEVVTIHQNNETVDGSGSAEKKEDEGKNFTVEHQPVITTPLNATAMDGQNAATSEVDVVDGDGSTEKGEKIDHETVQLSPKDTCLYDEMVDAKGVEDGGESNRKGEKAGPGDPEHQGVDVSTESTLLSSEDLCLNFGTADAKAVVDHVMGNNLMVSTQIQLENTGEECGSPQRNGQVNASDITETSNHGVGKPEVINLVPTEVARNSDVSVTNHASIHSVEQKLANEEPASEADKTIFSHDEAKTSAISLWLGYLSHQENKKQFSPSELVWGKVRSHPWWPAQIFTPEDASVKAVKHYKKDAYLVAYFGDRTFAWNYALDLKPFVSHFSQFKKLSNSEAFQNAVNCALEEVSRRVELGLACSCIPKEAEEKIECQVIDNAGICEESSHRYGVDQCTGVASFEPEKLLRYVSNLAPCASSGVDELDLVIAQAQLASFCRYKGYRWSSEFHVADVELSADEKVYSRRPISLKSKLREADPDFSADEKVYSRRSASRKSKHTTKDGSLSRKKKSLVGFLHDEEFSSEAESGSFSDDLSNSVPENTSESDDLGESIPMSSGRRRKAPDSPWTDNHPGKSVPLSSGKKLKARGYHSALSSARKWKALDSPSATGNHVNKPVSSSSSRKRKAHDSPPLTEDHLGKSVHLSSGRKRKAFASPSSTGNRLGKSVPSTSSRKRKALDSPSSSENHPGIIALDSPSSTENYPDKSVPLSFGRKQKAVDSLVDESGKRRRLSASKSPALTSQTPKPSFKIGECIRRVASQFKDSAAQKIPTVNTHPEDQSVFVSEKSFSVAKILSQLEVLAQNPSNGHRLQNNVRSLIMRFRSSLKRRGKKGKLEPTTGSSEEFEFCEGNDSYWLGRNVQNYSGEQLSDEAASSGSEESLDYAHRSDSMIQLPCGHYAMDIMELDEDEEEWRKKESSPAELILKFEERESLPSEINLNKLFRRFGSLMESETEVDHESGCAKVMFKRGSDAEVARHSGEKFNIFGTASVKYKICYSPVIPVKISPMEADPK